MPTPRKKHEPEHECEKCCNIQVSGSFKPRPRAPGDSKAKKAESDKEFCTVRNKLGSQVIFGFYGTIEMARASICGHEGAEILQREDKYNEAKMKEGVDTTKPSSILDFTDKLHSELCIMLRKEREETYQALQPVLMERFRLESQFNFGERHMDNVSNDTFLELTGRAAKLIGRLDGIDASFQFISKVMYRENVKLLFGPKEDKGE